MCVPPPVAACSRRRRLCHRRCRDTSRGRGRCTRDELPSTQMAPRRPRAPSYGRRMSALKPPTSRRRDSRRDGSAAAPTAPTATITTPIAASIDTARDTGPEVDFRQQRRDDPDTAGGASVLSSPGSGSSCVHACGARRHFLQTARWAFQTKGTILVSRFERSMGSRLCVREYDRRANSPRRRCEHLVVLHSRSITQPSRCRCRPVVIIHGAFGRCVAGPSPLQAE